MGATGPRRQPFGMKEGALGAYRARSHLARAKSSSFPNDMPGRDGPASRAVCHDARVRRCRAVQLGAGPLLAQCRAPSSNPAAPPPSSYGYRANSLLVVSSSVLSVSSGHLSVSRSRRGLPTRPAAGSIVATLVAPPASSRGRRSTVRELLVAACRQTRRLSNLLTVQSRCSYQRARCITRRGRQHEPDSSQSRAASRLVSVAYRRGRGEADESRGARRSGSAGRQAGRQAGKQTGRASERAGRRARRPAGRQDTAAAPDQQAAGAVASARSPSSTSSPERLALFFIFIFLFYFNLKKISLCCYSSISLVIRSGSLCTAEPAPAAGASSASLMSEQRRWM